MNQRRIFAPLLVAAILGYVDSGPATQAAAQAVAPIIEITAEPNHHLLLENQYVRVFKVELAPHAAMILHHHRHDYFFVSIGPSEIENDVAGKPPALRKFQDGETFFVPGNFAHTAKNLSDRPFQVIAVELMQNDQAHLSPNRNVKGDDERGLHILNGGTEDILFVKDNVRVTDLQLNPGGVLPKHHHAGPQLVVAVTDLDLRSEMAGKGASAIRLKTGEVVWTRDALTRTLTNAGRQKARLITLEFP